jgi:hypothetical protein
MAKQNENAAAEVATTEEVAVEAKATRVRKLSKAIEGSVVTIEVMGQTTNTYDFNSLPEEIQAKLGPFGLASKLGDCAAGREGADAAEAIKKAFDGMLAGDWTVRTAAAPKITISSIKENLAKLSDTEREAAMALLAGLGVKL